KTYRSFRAMADFTRALELLSRYESRYERQMARAYKTLMDYNPEDVPNEPNPEIEHDPADPQPIDSTPEIEPNNGITAQHTADPGPRATDHHPHAMTLSPSTPETDPNNGIPAQHTADPGPRFPDPGFSAQHAADPWPLTPDPVLSDHGPRATDHRFADPPVTAEQPRADIPATPTHFSLLLPSAPNPHTD
ncbi:MAG TPA: hypothetical protein VFA04_17850, partial [Bryobacteraceae bacterium]|nr:hypothetical protein [Bryobacteraceae bacterium]